MSTLVENVGKVVAAHAALKDAIAAKGVEVPEGTKLSGMPALVGQIETGGATEPNISRAVFSYGDYTTLDVPSTMTVDMTAISSLSYCFHGCSSLTSLTLPAGFGQSASSLIYCFSNCSRLTSLTLPAGFGQFANAVSSCFQGCSSLTSLTLPDGFARNAVGLGGCFNNCAELTNIYGNPNFKASLNLSPCPNLTHDSLMVVINGLQTVTTTQTLTLGAENLAKLSDDDKKVATDKGWTLA